MSMGNVVGRSSFVTPAPSSGYPAGGWMGLGVGGWVGGWVSQNPGRALTPPSPPVSLVAMAW